MSKTSTHSFELGRAGSSTPTFDISAIVPILACAFPAILAPLIYYAFPPAAGLQGILASRTENGIFWLAITAISVVLALRNHSRLGRLTVSPRSICLLAYLMLAGASVLWAF